MTKKKRSVAPIYLVAALWLGWSLLGSLYLLRHFIACALVSMAVYVVGKAIWPDTTYTVQEEPAVQTKPEKEEKKTTGDAELDRIVEEKDKAIAEMCRLDEAIEDEKISSQIRHLEEVTGKIVTHVVENPGQKSQISRFLNYYLPTTLKLLNAYDRMDEAGVSGVNIDGTKGKIEDMMDTICTAFDKQLDALFGDVALDISTDITVMENLMASEGLSDAQTMTMGG